MIAEVGINWHSLTYTAGSLLKAVIAVNEASGQPSTGLAWTLFRNNVQIATGTTPVVEYHATTPGLYRIVATARVLGSPAVSGNSSVQVTGGFEVQATPIPTPVNPSCVYLGGLYTAELTGGGGPCLVLPYQLASFTETIPLLPGTTHVCFDIDPLQNTVDDEVVVRTALGNWVLRGYPTGLYTEDVGYDYRDNQPLLPAPADGFLRLTVDAWNVHGDTAGPFSFRVRVKCYRQTAPIYEYVRCPYSTHPGGAGERARKFAALFTEMDIETDTQAGLSRLGGGTNTYKVVPVESVPLQTLAASGTPHRPRTPTGAFFTDSNWFAVCEPVNDELPEIDINAVSALEGIRPFYLTLTEPGVPPIVQRVKRLGGKMVIYMAQGALTAGTVVTAKVMTSSHGEVSFSYSVTADVYNDSTDTFQRIGDIDIDLTDFQFSGPGVLVTFTVDESAATPAAFPCAAPDVVWGDETIFSTTKARNVTFDGACYQRPTVQDTVDTEVSAIVTPNNGCHELACGPVGVYCYQSIDGSTSAQFQQPLHFPAPVLANVNEPMNCYQNPLFVAALDSNGQTDNPAVFDVNSGSLVAHTDTSLCGDAYLYRQCNDTSRNIVVVYPHATSPHSVVAYGEECWSRITTALNGSATRQFLDTLEYPAISVASAVAVPDCLDAACSGTNVAGASIVYIDTQTGMEQPVLFPHLDLGVPVIGAAPQVIDSGITLPAGEKTVTFTRARAFLFTSDVTTGVEVVVGLPGRTKRLVIVRASGEHAVTLGPGDTARSLNLVAGDSVYLDIGNALGRLTNSNLRVRTVVKWNQVVILPRLYHTVEVSSISSTAIRSLGFAGLTDKSPYTMFSTLPADTAQEFPNPDNIVTVQGASSPEYILIRSRAIGDPAQQLPGGIDWYSGQPITGNLTFRFYTSREDRGAHGEMDVWLESDGSFPVFITLDPFRELVLANGDIDIVLVVDISQRSTIYLEAIKQGFPSLQARLITAGVSVRYALITFVDGNVLNPNITTYSVMLSAVNGLHNDANEVEFGSLALQRSATALFRAGSNRYSILVTDEGDDNSPPSEWSDGSYDIRNAALAALQAKGVHLLAVRNPTSADLTDAPTESAALTYDYIADQTGGRLYDIHDLVANPAGFMDALGSHLIGLANVKRRMSIVGDISRNSVRVASSATASIYPIVYTAEDGQSISVTRRVDSVTYNNKLFFPTAQADPGISSVLISP